jgi:iron complex outermembrane recepter protein
MPRCQPVATRPLHLLTPLALAAALASTAPVAHAQAAAGTAADNNESVITISAQRRNEEIQKAPLSITAVSSKELELKQIRRLDDLKVEVPNVVIEQNTGTSTGAKIFMRGVGTDESLFTADPSVAIYIDDTYIARQTGAMFDMFDLQRVEVLRGPQGTLYGRNATGGAIRYITKKPNGEQRLEVDTRIGNLGRIDANLSGGGRIGETAAVSFGLMSKNRDGYLQDITNNSKVNDEQMVGARLGLAMPVTNNTSLRLSLDTLKQSSGPVYASGVLDAAGAALYKRAVNNADGNLNTIETNLNNGINDLNQGGLSVSTSTEMPGFEWRNIVTYRQMHNELYIDLDGSRATSFHLYQNQHQKQYSYESQFISSGKGPLNWTAGLFWFNEKNHQPTRQDIFATGGVTTVKQDTTATALYGQADYKFAGIFRATLGARYSHETKDFSLSAIRANGTLNFDFAAKNSWSRTDWKLGLDAQINNNVLAYGSATTGFKSGGFNGRATSAAAALLTLKPETVLTYELGVKTTLLGGAARFNISVFQNDYKDLQLTAFNSAGVSVLSNAASAIIKGVEIDTSAQLTKEWQISANVGTLDAKYKDFTAANAAIFDGKQLKQAPKLQYGLSTSYRVAMGNGALVFGAQLKHVGEHFQNLNNSPIIKTEAYSIVDARASYEAAGGKWSTSLWGKNLADKRYYTGGFDLSALNIADVYLNVPRTYGIDFKYSFW